MCEFKKEVVDNLMMATFEEKQNLVASFPQIFQGCKASLVIKASPFGLISVCTPAVMTDITLLFSVLPPKESIVTGTLGRTFLWCLL